MPMRDKKTQQNLCKIFDLSLDKRRIILYNNEVVSNINLCLSGKGRESNWQKFVLAKTNPWKLLLSVLREAVLRTALSLKFVKENTMRSLR